jgi:hypothetical protein
MSQAKTSLVEVADSTDALKTARSEPIQQEQPRQTMNFIRSLVLDIPVQDYKDTTETAPMNIERMLETQLDTEVKKIENPKDKIDTITVDVPLMIRLLEYAREDAKTDMALHDVTEKLIALSKENPVLSMDQYDSIMNDKQGGNKDYPQPSFADEPQAESVDLLKKLAGIR